MYRSQTVAKGPCSEAPPLEALAFLTSSSQARIRCDSERVTGDTSAKRASNGNLTCRHVSPCRSYLGQNAQYAWTSWIKSAQLHREHPGVAFPLQLAHKASRLQSLRVPSTRTGLKNGPNSSACGYLCAQAVSVQLVGCMRSD